MRLTLRTLLAYMDDILDPADHEELGRKIEASEFATDLIHSSRDTVRRLRLSAPDVLDTDKGVDVNMVAGYLDNTLAPEAVAEYERVCLESDMHLAEVASCHNVLAMVLGEPAEVNDSVRQRLYSLPNDLAEKKQLRIEPAHPETQPQVATPVEAPRATAPAATETEVPDYLQAAVRSKRRAKRWLITAVLLICVVGYFASGALYKPEPPSELAGSDTDLLISGGIDISGPSETSSSTDTVASTAEGNIESEAPAFDAGSMESAPPFSPPATGPTAESSASADTPGAMAAAGAGGVANGTTVAPMTVPSTGPPTGPPTAGTPGAGPTHGPAADQATASLTEPALPGAMPEPSSPDAEVNAGELKPMPDATMPSDSGEVRSDSAGGGQPSVDEPEENAAARGPVRLGTYMSNNDVLLQFDTRRNAWVRVPSRSGISTGDRLLTLPKFRTHVVLAGVNAYLSGGTQIAFPMGEYQVTSQPADLSMEVVYGRVLLNAGLDGSDVVLKIGEQLRYLQLGGSASLAIEANRNFIPGSNTEEEPAPIVATWYLTSGTLQLSGDGMDTEIQAPAVWRMANGSEESPKMIDELPKWIDREQISGSERLALTVLDNELTPGEPVGIRLLELNDPQQRGRRREVRSLAAQCGVYVGEFEPFAKSLNDKQQKAAWKSHIDTLRQAMALSPKMASRVRDAFVAIRGESAADDLMQMVRGYDAEAIGTTPEAVQEGVLRQLIRWLDNDSLDYRVLAYHNLQEITGKSIGGYRPEHSSTQRQRALRIWRNRLDSGELLPGL